MKKATKRAVYFGLIIFFLMVAINLVFEGDYSVQKIMRVVISSLLGSFAAGFSYGWWMRKSEKEEDE